MSVDKKQIGKRLKARRTYLRLPQRILAEQIGLTTAAYGHYEAGRNAISTADLAIVAKFLRVPISYFYEDDPLADPDPGDLTRVPDYTDLPEALQKVVGFQAKVYKDLPPGPRRDAYVRRLYEDTEAYAALAQRIQDARPEDLEP